VFFEINHRYYTPESEKFQQKPAKFYKKVCFANPKKPKLNLCSLFRLLCCAFLPPDAKIPKYFADYRLFGYAFYNGTGILLYFSAHELHGLHRLAYFRLYLPDVAHRGPDVHMT